MRFFYIFLIVLSFSSLAKSPSGQPLTKNPQCESGVSTEVKKSDCEIKVVNMSFKDALNAHLETIKARDLEGFVKTVVQDERLLLIMPNGAKISGFKAAKELHAQWFADPDWHIEIDIINLIETKTMSTAILDVKYSDLNAEGKPYSMQYYLNVTFVFENGKWLLILDQNTKY